MAAAVYFRWWDRTGSEDDGGVDCADLALRGFDDGEAQVLGAYSTP
jgi:hypothetical protein